MDTSRVVTPKPSRRYSKAGVSTPIACGYENADGVLTPDGCNAHLYGRPSSAQESPGLPFVFYADESGPSVFSLCRAQNPHSRGTRPSRMLFDLCGMHIHHPHHVHTSGM